MPHGDRRDNAKRDTQDTKSKKRAGEQERSRRTGDPELVEERRSVVREKLKCATEANAVMTVKERHELIKSTLKTSADEALPRAPQRVNGKIKRLDDR